MELAAEHGTDAIAAARGDSAIGASHHERSEDRRGHRNGCKPKTLAGRVGGNKIQIPETRRIPFHPDCLERSRRSERAFINALAEMYVHGVSTRTVAAVVEELCGIEVSSSTASQAAALLDAELEAWETRPIGQVKHLILDARHEQIRGGGRRFRASRTGSSRTCAKASPSSPGRPATAGVCGPRTSSRRTRNGPAAGGT